MFSCEYWGILKNTYFEKRLPTQRRVKGLILGGAQLAESASINGTGGLGEGSVLYRRS